MDKKQNITFKQLYQQLRDEGFTSRHIIAEIAATTKTSEATVRNWVYTDRAPQSALVADAIAERYGVSAQSLF